MEISDILIKPLITEKSNAMSAGGVYTFKVGKHANKINIAHAVESLFSVQVDKVRIAIQKPKVKKNMRTGKASQTATLKKAYVYIKGGKKIPELDL